MNSTHITCLVGQMLIITSNASTVPPPTLPHTEYTHPHVYMCVIVVDVHIHVPCMYVMSIHCKCTVHVLYMQQ